MHTNSNVDARDAIRVCLPGNGVLPFEFRSHQYVHIDANRWDSVEHFTLILSVRDPVDF
jgi:hypothetical protein